MCEQLLPLFSLPRDMCMALHQGLETFTLKCLNSRTEAVTGVQEMVREIALLAPGLF